MNWADYSYASDGSIMMVLLIIILGVLVTYLLLDKRTRTDKWSSKCDVWSGEDIEPEYNVNQEGIPYTPSLNIPFDDPEVPARLKKPKKRKTTLARGIKPAKRKTKKRMTKRKTK